MTPQGIQSYLEEKEIVCCGWFLDTVDGWSPDTILLLQPNGMVEIVGSIPSCISQTQTNYYYDEVSWRTINFSCIDGLVYVWLSCIDCGCIESATSLRCDSNPVPQTNLGLTSLYSLLIVDGSHQWIDYPLVWFLHIETTLFTFLKRSTCRGVGIGSMLVAHHFLSMDFALAFSNKNPHISLFKNFCQAKLCKHSNSGIRLNSKAK